MKLTNYFIALLLLSFSVSAQKYELGEVTKQELEEKAHPADPSAPAAILFSKGTTFLVLSEQEGFSLVTEVEMKIKIYTKDGYEWANKVIPYYSSDSENETIDISKAVTYNLVDGAVEKTKLRSEGEFSEQVNRFWKQKKIVMPDVREGSIVEYKYVIRSPFTHIFPEWRFQESIPVNHSEFVTKIPEYFTYMPSFRGYIFPKVERTSAIRTFNYTSKERTNRSTEFTNNKIEYSESIISYTLENIPALKGERFVNNIENYISSVEHELTMTKYPNEPVKSFSHTWEDVAKTIYDYDDFGPELRKTGYFEDDINALLAGVSSPEEKLVIIYEYVKGRMNWNNYYGYSCIDGVRKAYMDKTGNVAEINLMLTAMLRHAGIEANPVLVSTRSNKIALFPNRTAFNYVICAAEVNGGIVLLDATSKSALPDIMPVRALNWTGRLIKKDGTSLPIDLMPQSSSREVISIVAKIDNEGKVSGKARDQYFDYNAYAFREKYSGMGKESYLKSLESKYKGIEIDSHTLADDDMSKPVMEEFSFSHNSLTDVIGDKIYINPMLFLTQKENPFKQEKREYPIDFIFPFQDKYMINITIPEGYIIESIPQPVAVSMEQNIGSFKFNIQATDANIQLMAVLDLNYANISADYYPTIKDFFQKMIEKQNEKIILTKKI